MLIKVTLSSDIVERTKHSLHRERHHPSICSESQIHPLLPPNTRVDMFGYEDIEGADSIVQTLDFTYYVTSY